MATTGETAEKSAPTQSRKSSSSSRGKGTTAQADGVAHNDTKPNGGSRAYGQGAMIGAAAAGLLAGLAATIGRKAASQAMVAMSGDWFEALKAEHQLALKLLDKIEATTTHQTTKRTLLLMQLKHALAKHAFEEENVIYPALREHGDDERADHLNHDHGYVKQYLYELEQRPKNTTSWLDKARELRRELEKHMREEEDTIFPALHAKLDKEHNAALTSALNKEGFKLA